MKKYYFFIFLLLLASGCTSNPSLNDESDEPIYDLNQYSWSTMNEGPYNDKISFATSTDLINWQDSKEILAEHASVPDIIYKNGTIYAYFVDVSTEGYPEKIGYITSQDNGTTWSERKFVIIDGLNQKRAVDPTAHVLENGQIRLFYLDLADSTNPTISTNKIYSAISDDGINFVEENGFRFEYEGIYDPCVIRISENLWRMYVGSQDGQKVLYATSTDGLNFEYGGIAYTGGAIPKVIYENGTYYLFTGGIDIFTSQDGLTFTEKIGHFDNGKLTADPGVIKISENNYLMIYKTKDMN